MSPLQVFEKHPETDAYRVGGFFSPYCLLSEDKRFSDAELAAEMWHAKNANMRARYSYLAGGGEPTHAYFWSQYDAKDETFARFARLPHAHENDYQ